MPLRTAKPTVRIVTKPDRYEITFFPVFNNRHVKGIMVEAPKTGSAEFKEIVDKLINDTRARWGMQEK